MSVTVRKSKVTHQPLCASMAPTLLALLCESDRDELIALHGESKLLDVITQSLETSKAGSAVHFDGGLAYCWGICDYSQQVGIVWMLATDFGVSRPASMFKSLRRIVSNFHRCTEAEELINMTSVANTRAVKLIKRLGGKFCEDRSFEYKGGTYMSFSFFVDHSDAPTHV